MSLNRLVLGLAAFGLMPLLQLSVEAVTPGWTNVTPPSPTARFRHSMAYDSNRGRTVLFGGTNGSDLGDTWEWDGVAWTLFPAAGPSPRSEFAMAFDSARGKVVLHGGYDGVTSLGDTWEWDGTSWTQRTNSGPPLAGHAMAFDSVSGRVVLFGGYYSFGETYIEYGNTWEWDGTAWTQVAITGPSARYWHSMAYDSSRDRIVLFGGHDLSSANHGDTWEWDGALWTQRASNGPSPRSQSAMAF